MSIAEISSAVPLPALGIALTGGLLIGGARSDAAANHSAASPDQPSYEFDGEHQAGILRPAPANIQSFASVTSFDLTARTAINSPDC